MFWPQTKIIGNSKICQPSGPVAANTNIVWNISDLNMILEFIPFVNCQGIPVKVTSIINSYLNSSAFTIDGNKIVIDIRNNINELRRLDTSDLVNQVNANQTITIVVDAETDTIIPIKSQSTFSIFVNNSKPVFKNVHESIKVKISEGLNFSITYSNFCLSDSSLVTVNDDDKDSIYLTVNLDFSGYLQNQVVLNNQE